jgi:ferredoxin--NADP+ reductase
LSKFTTETVLAVRHWDGNLFSFRTTRDQGLRFVNGQFVMVGLELDGRPLLRAYSVASPAHDEHLEFLSIKVPDGALTSRLQHVQPGDTVLVSKKPTGSLIISDLRPGRRLYLLGTGTGLAPYMSIIHDPETYDRFETVVLVHGVRTVSELAYADYVERDLLEHDYYGEMVRGRLIYHPTVTREPFRNKGRITDIIETGALFEAAGLPQADRLHDRFMLCGSPAFLKDGCRILDERGFAISPNIGAAGDYVIERAFVEQ